MSPPPVTAPAEPSALPVPPPPPGMLTYLQNGFNLKNSSFLTSRIFKITYAKGNVESYNGNNYTIPDQVTSFVPELKTDSSSSQSFMRTVADYKYAFSISVSAGLKDESYAASTDSNLTYSSEMFTDISCEYYVNFSRQNAYSMARDLDNIQGSLDPTFADDLSSLPVHITGPDSYASYFRFFTKYGTHFLVNGSLGGFFIQTSSISKSLIKSTSALSIKTAIEGSFNTTIGKVSASVSGSYDQTTAITQYKDQIFATLSSIGGHFKNIVEDFYESCLEHPVLLLGLGEDSLKPLVQPLSALITGDHADTRIKTMDAACRTFLGVRYISEPDAFDLSTNLEYGTDAILVDYTDYDVNGGRGYTTASVGPRGTPPSPCAYAAGHLYTDDDRYASRTNLAFPLSQSDHATVTQETFYSGPPKMALNKFSLGRTDGGPPIFGPTTAISISPTAPVVTTAATDGLLLVGLTEGSDGARGTTIVKVGDVLRGAASIHYYPANDVHYRQESMLIPIRKGEIYTVTCDTTFGTVNYSAQWTPMTTALTFDTLVSLVPYGIPSQTPYTLKSKADTDGFVVLVLDGRENNGARGFGTLQLAPSDQYLGTDPTMAGTSVHFYPGSDTWLPCNSAILPVPKGWHYQISVVWSLVDFNIAAYWVPLINPDDPTP